MDRAVHARETAVERESLRKSKTAGDLWQLESETQILLGKENV